MKNEKIKVITKGKPSFDVLNQKEKDLFFSELLAAFINYKKEKEGDLKDEKK